jgi:biopolymer transport protein TolR
MGAAVGTGGGKRDVNVDLNIVPFIDLMSCLTAFLLVTAVWVQIAQLGLKPKGKSRDPTMLKQEDEKVVLSVLIQSDNIWIVQSRIGDQQSIPLPPRNETDNMRAAWSAFGATLTEIKKSAYFVDRSDIELAAESLSEDSRVVYQDIIFAMDVAKKAGFSDIGLTERDSLTAKPQL